MTNCKNMSCKCQKKNEKSDQEHKSYQETHNAEAFVLSCIDYRFIDVAVNFLEESDLNRQYDYTALAGASLAYNQTKFKYWGVTLLDQFKLGIDLHHINQIIVFDHMDCGAYTIFYPGLEPNSEEERILHIKNIKKFIHSLKELFPDLTYTGYLINVDGEVEQIYPKKD